MKIKLAQWEDWDIVSVEGALIMTRLTHTPPIFGVLGEKAGAKVALDLSQTDAMDSGALSILLSLKRQLHTRGGQLVVLAPSEDIRILFGIVGFDDRLRVFDSRAEFESYANRPTAR